MKNNLLMLAMGIPFVALVSSCDQSPPKCSDEQTISLVKDIVSEQVREGKIFSEKDSQNNLAIEYARASSYDKTIKKLTCEARIVSGGSYQLSITYESQLDDNDQHIVSVSGIQIGDLIGLQNGIINALKKEKQNPVDIRNQETSPLPPQTQTPTPASEPDLETCTMSKVAAYRAEVGPDENGEERLVRADMLEEWEKECREGT